MLQIQAGFGVGCPGVVTGQSSRLSPGHGGDTPCNSRSGLITLPGCRPENLPEYEPKSRPQAPLVRRLANLPDVPASSLAGIPAAVSAAACAMTLTVNHAAARAVTDPDESAARDAIRDLECSLARRAGIVAETLPETAPDSTAIHSSALLVRPF
jgi:hypothetical protein